MKSVQDLNLWHVKLQLKKSRGKQIAPEYCSRHRSLTNVSGCWIDRCCVGTGNSNSVVTQTSLDTFKASTTTTQGAIEAGIQVTTLPYYMWLRSTYRFGEGVAAGNISEIGLGWANANLWNRALVKDSNGNPTTITVLADEYLDVITEIRVYPQEIYQAVLIF